MPIEKIRISGGYYTIVNREDAVFACMFNWYADDKKTQIYAKRRIYFNCESKIISLHNEIVTQRIGLIIPEGFEVDHFDRDGLNNTRDNLRIVTHSINVFNKDLQINNTSGYRGVHFEAFTQKWRAEIKINQINIRLGRYSNIQDAIAARQAAELKYLGEIIK